METKQYPFDIEVAADEEDGDHIDVERLRHLVRLLDHSDVSEVEVRRVAGGIHLVLRKAVAADGQVEAVSGQVAAPPFDEIGPVTAVEKKPHAIIAPLVGIFHPWGKPGGKPLVAVGDHVNVGQLVGSIQSLNVIYEVESSAAGRVVEILIQDGQPVEYGQQLLLIDSSEEL